MAHEVFICNSEIRSSGKEGVPTGQDLPKLGSLYKGFIGIIEVIHIGI